MDRIPPQNIEAEQSLLGGLLLGGKLQTTIATSDFYCAAHRTIFNAITQLEVHGEPTDTVTVNNKLKEMGKTEEVGGPLYLASLVERTPSFVNINHYAEIVREHSVKRRVAALAGNLHQFAFDPSKTAEELVNAFQTDALSLDGVGSKAKSMLELSKNFMRELEVVQKSPRDRLGLPTGLHELDRLTSGIQAPDLIIIAARPSIGKTALALDLAKAACRDNASVYLASLEMSAQQICTRMVATGCGISGRNLRLGKFLDSDWPRVVETLRVVSSLTIEIDNTPSISDLELARRVRAARPDLLIVDYLQLMQSAQKTDRKDLEIANITACLKGLAKELHIPVVLLSQLNRDAEKRKNPRPRLVDLRESGAIEQDADVVLGIYRAPDEPEVAELICLKQRNGPLGMVRVAFREKIASFANLVT